MIVSELEKELKPIPCPLCRNEKDIIVYGHEYALDEKGHQTNQIKVDQKSGYAFCNCRNIFYTKWNHKYAEVYDTDYTAKYNADRAKEVVARYRCYVEQMKKLGRPDGYFLEIGAASDAVLDEAKKLGMSVHGVDIMKRQSNHKFTCANFETEPMSEKYDHIFASHVWEHFLDPIQAAAKAFALLNDGGLIFISMPDPYQIEWRDPYAWGHWHLKEHHIMWDMDSFCEVMEQLGFEVVFKHRNFSNKFICVGDYHLMFRKP